MKAQVIEGFLGNLSRESDMYMPFVAMLQASGYTHTHCIGGVYEFGKDILARKDGQQWLFQLKRGNITSTEYAEITTQCLEMYESTSGHPDLDENLPRKAVVAFSGHFVGKATEMFADFNTGTIQKRGYEPVEFWTKTRLVEMLSEPDCLGEVNWQEIGKFLSSQFAGEANVFEVSSFADTLWSDSRTLQELWRCALEAAVLRTEFQRNGLGIHSTFILLALLRSVSVAEMSNKEGEGFVLIREIIRNELLRDSSELLEWFASLAPENRDGALISIGSDIVEFSTRTLLLMEIVALGTLSARGTAFNTKEFFPRAKDFLQHCMQFGATQKPISDNYAVSILNIAVAARILDINLESWLRGVSTWVEKCYEHDGLGLARFGSTPREELWYTVGAAIENDQVVRNNLSALAVAVLDATCLLGLEGAYRENRQRFVSTKLIPCRTLPIKSPADLDVNDSSGSHLVMKNDFWEAWEVREGWQNSDSHLSANVQTFFDEAGESWVLPALSTVLRDRYWLRALSDLLKLERVFSNDLQAEEEGSQKKTSRTRKRDGK